MNKRFRTHRAFTLVELMIVISVLAILAALVIPRLSTATDVARAGSAHSQLTTARKQLELWKMQHGAVYPTLAQMQMGASDWGVFTARTQPNGLIDASGDLGPYFPSAPVNPFTNSSLVVASGSAVISAGWTYNASTGALKVILPGAVDPASTEFTTNDYEQIVP